MLSSLFVLVIALGAVAAQTYPNTAYQAKPPAYSPPSSNPPVYSPPASNPPVYSPPASNSPASNSPTYKPAANAPGYNVPGNNAPASYPNPSYNNAPVNAARNLGAEVDDARQRIGVVEGDTVLLAGLADDITNKVNLVTAFQSEFTNKIYPTIQAYSKAQDQRIASYRAQIAELSTLQDDVENLAIKVEEILKTLAANRERRSVITGELSRLDDKDVAQNFEIGKLETLIKSEGVRLVDAAYKVNSNKAKANEITDNLGKAVNVINFEQGETFTVALSSAYPSAVYNFLSPFPAVPDVTWAITGAQIEDLPAGGNDYNNYGSQTNYNKDESINGKVNVSANATSATVSLVDNSDGFQISKIRLRLTATLIDNSYLEYTSKSSNYY